MRRIRLLAVGRIKSPHWRAAADFYKKRLLRSVLLDEQEVKDADPALPIESRKEQECSRLLGLLRPADTVICLDENGKSHSSRAFAELLGLFADTGKTPCFIVGGAYGLTEAALSRAQLRLSFGPMTFPHELARVMLFEQLYRAQTILAGTGYHH